MLGLEFYWNTTSHTMTFQRLSQTLKDFQGLSLWDILQELSYYCVWAFLLIRMFVQTFSCIYFLYVCEMLLISGLTNGLELFLMTCCFCGLLLLSDVFGPASPQLPLAVRGFIDVRGRGCIYFSEIMFKIYSIYWKERQKTIFYRHDLTFVCLNVL